MQDLCSFFNGVDDPRRSNARRHDLQEMLTIAFPFFLSGGRNRADMERFGRMKEGFLQRFMALEHGIPSHDAFSDLSDAPAPEGLHGVLTRMLVDWGARPGDVTAIDGKALRRSFGDAPERSPLHPVHAFAAESGLLPGQVRVDGRSNGITAVPALPGCWSFGAGR